MVLVIGGTWAPPQQPDQVRSSPWRTVVTFVRAVVVRVLVNPLRDGHLRVHGPRGYTAMVLLACAAIVLALTAALLAPTLRDRLTLVPTFIGIDVPSQLAGAVLALLVLAVALMHTAALHAPVWGRVAGAGVAMVYLSGVALHGYPADAQRALQVTTLAFALLVGLQVLQWRRRTAWWELPAVLATYALATGLVLVPTMRAAVAIGSGAEVEAVWLLLLNITTFATPVVLVASLAIAQVGLRAAVWTTRGLRVLAPGWLALLVCLLVLGYRAVVDVVGWVDTWEGSGTRVAGGAAFLVACALAWGVVEALSRRRSRRPLGELTGDLTSFALPLAALATAGDLIAALILSPLGVLEQIALDTGAAGLVAWTDSASALGESISGALGSDVVAYTAVALMLLAAALLAMRGWLGPSGFVAVLAVVYGTSAWTGLEVPTYYLPLVVTASAAFALVVLLVARRLSIRRLEAITLLGLLATLLELRDVISEPLVLLLGAGGSALVALTWAFLTGGGTTAAPQGRRGRAAWFLGYSLLGFTAVAFAALAGNPAATFDAEAVSQSGDRLFGTAIVMTAIIACLRSVLLDRDLGELT